MRYLGQFITENHHFFEMTGMSYLREVNLPSFSLRNSRFAFNHLVSPGRLKFPLLFSELSDNILSPVPTLTTIHPCFMKA